MITVISSTNRKGSNSIKIAKHYVQLLEKHSTEEVKLLDLETIPMSWYENEGLKADHHHPELKKIQEDCIIPAERFVFIIPEYNGSFPGVLKLFIDACSLYKMGESFKVGTKKALLAGVASGRAGNLRGLEHFSGVLNYLNVIVMPNRLPISSVHALFDESGAVKDESTLKVTEMQVVDFLKM
jgi:chromate reductase, NAD(P)H dehydrogenase (quinone)